MSIVRQQGLAAAIGRRDGRGIDCHHGADIDDRAPVARDEARQCSPREPGQRSDIDRQHGIERFQIKISGGAEARDARIVDQHVDGSICGQNVCHLPQPIRTRQIGSHGLHGYAMRWTLCISR